MIMPKLTVTNYPEMLRKLSTAMLFVTIGCLWLLRAYVAPIDSTLKRLDIITPQISVFEAVKIPFGTFLVAFLIAFLSESIKLHDKVSDFFRIRREFDIRWILIPMALLSSAQLTAVQFAKLGAERVRLMDDVFYAYASGSAERQVIDGHAITQALTTWSWYWLCVETIAVVIPTAAILALSGKPFWVESLLAIVLFLMLMMRVFRADCAK